MKRTELEVFLKASDELIASKYIVADVKIVGLLKSIASSETLLALFKNCLDGFNFEQAKKKYFVKSQYLPADKCEFQLPPNSRELLALVFYVLMDIDSKRISFSDFLNKYFYVDGSFVSSYDAFITGMIKPFKNSVKVLIEGVIDGKLQDPIEAFKQEEERKEKEKVQQEEDAKKQQELLAKTSGQSIKDIKELLGSDIKKVKESKLDDQTKDELLLVINMLANVLESNDKDAIEYAFIAYKYATKAHFIIFSGKLKKVSALIKDVLNAI